MGNVLIFCGVPYLIDLGVAAVLLLYVYYVRLIYAECSPN